MAATTMKTFVKSVSKLVEDVQNTTVDRVFEFVKDKVSNPAEFQTQFEEFKKGLKLDEYVFSAGDAKKGGVEKKKRTPSKYNTYIGNKIKELKEVHKDKDGKVLMKMAIDAWKAEGH